MSVCLCVYMLVCLCVFVQHFFLNTYFIKQYRHPLSTNFSVYPFDSSHQCYWYPAGIG